MNKERLLYHFVQREILSTYQLISSPHFPLSLTFLTLLSPSRLPTCLTNFCLPHASGLPQQLLSPSRSSLRHSFRLAWPASNCSRFCLLDASLSLTVLSLALVTLITFASYKKGRLCTSDFFSGLKFFNEEVAG